MSVSLLNYQHDLNTVTLSEKEIFSCSLRFCDSANFFAVKNLINFSKIYDSVFSVLIRKSQIKNKHSHAIVVFSSSLSCPKIQQQIY